MAEEEPIPFTDLMALANLVDGDGENERYMSITPCFNAGGGAAYGGHVYAQAVWAASQSVGAGMVVHNVHGYFTLPGHADRPYIYSVTHLSEGRSYCTRNVTVRQPLVPSISLDISIRPRSGKKVRFRREEAGRELGKICFSCICSFKRDETESFEGHGLGGEENVQERWKEVLGKRRGSEWEKAPGQDAPWFYRTASSSPPPHLQPFPGLDIRKVDMSSHNASKPPLQYRTLALYRPLGLLPKSLPNLHACAHLYASDRNSLFLISNALDFGDQIGRMGSLSHSVTFHVRSEELLLRGEGMGEGKEKGEVEEQWWVAEAWSPRSGQGRGLHESRLWSPGGVHVASTWQEGLVRRAEKPEDQKFRIAWEEGMKATGRLGGAKGKL